MERKGSLEAILSLGTKPESKYDVFLSFRGSDTRNNITDYLYHSMVRVGIRVFLDSEQLQNGEEISEVLKAVNESQIYIPIFSKNFASSKWCLREVARMVECTSKSDQKKEIIPIFYDVKADDVKLKTSLYKKALRKHRKKVEKDELERWKSALVKVGGKIGRELIGKRLGEEIESLVGCVCGKLNTGRMILTGNLVIDNSRVEAIMSLLDVGSDGVRFIGIHGMGGVGKTTIAKVIFNKLSSHFNGYCCFLEDVGASSQPLGGLLNLQKMLLSSFVSPRVIDPIGNVDSGIMWIQSVFFNRKVLIVLDNLDEKKQLEYLAGNSNWFGPGSRIIITTRDKSILNTQVAQPRGILRYEVLKMKLELALNLFCKYAFASDLAIEGYEGISEEIVRTVGMLPLAIAVVGSHLFELGNELEHLEKREMWDETLNRLKKVPSDMVQKTLMISYERLEPTHKQVFLDIACFFTNEDKKYPVIMWKDCGYDPHNAIWVLSHRSLIKIREDGRFWMHDQVRDFGKALEEYPHKICRVWIREKALKLLERKKINEDVEALTCMFNGHIFTQEELACLPKLRFLRVKECNFSGDFKNLLSELRWLSWQPWQMTVQASNFHFSNLVVLDLSDSNIGDGWGGWSQIKVTEKMKVLDLTGCSELTRTPDFSNFTSLESLILARCPKLITIDCSIGKLKNLKTLNIKGCSSLVELPEEVGSLHSLEEIVMPQNLQSLKLPERFGELKSLSSLILDLNPRISQLPKSIEGLVKLTRLSLNGCVGIKELPPSIGELRMLVELVISKSGIVILPDSIGKLGNLRTMKLSYTGITKFPRTIGQLTKLEQLFARKCWDLTDENLDKIGKLSHLRIMNLSYTSVSTLPAVIGGLPRLHTLEVGSNKLEKVTVLPKSLTSLKVQAIDFSLITDFSTLLNLHDLEIYRLSTFLKKEPYSTWGNDPKCMEEVWKKKQPVHQLPSRLSTLKLKGICPLPHFSKLDRLTVLRVSEFPEERLPVFEGLRHLTELKISICEQLEQIPNLSHLKNLKKLVLTSLKRLVKIPDLSELKSLQHLVLSRCRLIEELPNLSKLDKLQHLEVEDCPKLRALEGVEGLESCKLDSPGRTVLKRFLDIPSTPWICHKFPMYDVFLSFRGPDTRYSVISSLHKALFSSRISFFRDDDEVDSGEEIGEEIQQALDNSSIYIPVFSKDYASSQWCLRELVRMLERTSESKGEKRIISIFYDVEIDDVNLKSNLYKSVLESRQENFPTEVEAWEGALKRVTYMEGFDWKTNG